MKPKIIVLCHSICKVHLTEQIISLHPIVHAKSFHLLVTEAFKQAEKLRHIIPKAFICVYTYFNACKF